MERILRNTGVSDQAPVMYPRNSPIQIQADEQTSLSEFCRGFPLSIQIQDRYLKLNHPNFHGVSF
jgi:hypothetical protein